MDPRPNQHQLLYCNCISTVTNLYPIVKSCRVARSSVLHSKTLPQGEFISPEDFLSSRVPEKASLFWDGDPYRIRTDVKGVRGLCLNRLTNGPYKSRRLPIFTSRFQLTIFGTSELNFCVRNGNRWNLTVIVTDHMTDTVYHISVYLSSIS